MTSALSSHIADWVVCLFGHLKHKTSYASNLPPTPLLQVASIHCFGRSKVGCLLCMKESWSCSVKERSQCHWCVDPRASRRATNELKLAGGNVETVSSNLCASTAWVVSAQGRLAHKQVHKSYCAVHDRASPRVRSVHLRSYTRTFLIVVRHC